VPGAGRVGWSIVTASRCRRGKQQLCRALKACSSKYQTDPDEIVECAARVGITVELVLVEYAHLAFTDIRQVLT